jgi:maltose alpha-D-glucosyltransferase/alpha-amylase
MVTDEERDYMYRAYAHDPQARINLGIRRRLAPLLGNNRRRIELMNAMLFSLPGTPVLYYGDEIGMGDNIYLGDRNGVRTPMQWSADRNAGFSRANPQKLYLPAIIDPEYHYEAVNVESQQNNTSSLLWWMKRLIALRKQHKAFGRGALEFLRPDNPKVLAFLRSYGEERILVLANLSRFVQHAELDLRAYQGLVPEELFGRSLFPGIGERPYPFTLGPHAFYWFALVPARPGALAHRPEPEAELPVLAVRADWTELLQNSSRDRLEALLPAYLHRRHGEGRGPIKAVTIQEAFPLRYGDSLAQLILVRLEMGAGLPETDLLPLTFLTEEQQRRLLAPAAAAGLARVRGPQSGLLCDALADPTFCLSLLGAIVTGKHYSVTAHHSQYPVGGEVVAVPLPRLGELAEATAGAPQPVLNPNEQSNVSVIFGGRLILKVFRRLEEGINPDLEVGRFLTERQGFRGAAEVLGSIVYRRRNAEPTTLAVLHQYVDNQGDAWQLTLDELSSYFDRVLALRQEVPPHAGADLPLLGPGPPEGPDDVLAGLIGPYLETARLLGRRTAELHTALASDRSDLAFAPEPTTRLYQRSLYQSMRNLTGQVCFQLARQLDALPEPARPLAQRVLDAQEGLLRRFRSVLDRPTEGARIRTHGDYHLGKLLNTGNDFVATDFEGNPARSVSERRLKRQPFRDVANMVRSLHYAAYSALHGLATGRGRSPGMIRAEDRAFLEPWARAWYVRSAREFVIHYLEHLAPADLLPATPEARRSLLELFVLEKALEELGAELAHQPGLALLPLLGLECFLDRP